MVEEGWWEVSGYFVDVRLGSLSAHGEQREEFWAAMSPVERDRARAFKRDAAREHFVTSRGLLRQTLANYANCQPRDLQFEIGPHGKPFLLNRKLFFNLSHSNDSLLLAVSDMQEIGVDIESVRARDGLSGIAERSFSPSELAYWRGLPLDEQVPVFFRLWTIKEAFVKAVGRGIALGLASCEVDVGEFDGFAAVPECCGAASSWSARELDVGLSFKAALVAPNCTYVLRTLAFGAG